MIYLIYNTYKQQASIHYELRDINLETVGCNIEANHFSIGDFVEVVDDNFKKMVKTKRPDNYLDYFPKGKYNHFELKEQLLNYINSIENQNFSQILNKLVVNNNDFYIYPAAKSLHHAYIGGLCEHTLNMLFLANSYIELYQLDRDLLYTGIILHDYGKLKEYSDYGLRYSVEGNLLGHIMIAYEQVSIVANKLGINECNDIMMLKHLIISHHGYMAYGSPKEPMLKEALILHELDDVDAKMEMVNQSLNGIGDNRFGSPIPALDRQKFFNYVREEK